MSQLAGPPPSGTSVPGFVWDVADGEPVEAVWLNLRGGLTFRLGTQRYLKWAPGGSLRAERERLGWVGSRHPVPRLLDHGSDNGGEWLLSEALPGQSAVFAEPSIAARALGAGLRAFHDALPTDSCPFSWSPELRGAAEAAPPVDQLVVCHGDACVPNTLVDLSGEWSAHVDLGALGVADRWSDLAVAAWSLEANFGPGLDAAFYAAYGIDRDEQRVDYYSALWNAPSA